MERSESFASALIGGVGGALVAALAAYATHCTDNQHALRMKRYELSHVEAAKAYTELLTSLERFEDLVSKWRRDVEGRGVTTAGDERRHQRERDKAVDEFARARAGLDPYLDSDWRAWLDERSDVFASLVNDSRGTGSLHDEIRAGLLMRIFGREPEAEIPPTPTVRTPTLIPTPLPTPKPSPPGL